jgi:hypothetical protein
MARIRWTHQEQKQIAIEAQHILATSPNLAITDLIETAQQVLPPKRRRKTDDYLKRSAYRWLYDLLEQLPQPATTTHNTEIDEQIAAADEADQELLCLTIGELQRRLAAVEAKLA